MNERDPRFGSHSFCATNSCAESGQEVEGSSPPKTHRVSVFLLTLMCFADPDVFCRDKPLRVAPLVRHRLFHPAMPYFVYILQSHKHGRYYIGYTTDVQARLDRHNSGYVPSTKLGIPWKVVHVEQFSTIQDATRREYQIKAMKSTEYIKRLIKSRPVRTV